MPNFTLTIRKLLRDPIIVNASLPIYVVSFERDVLCNKSILGNLAFVHLRKVNDSRLNLKFEIGLIVNLIAATGNGRSGVLRNRCF